MSYDDLMFEFMHTLDSDRAKELKAKMAEYLTKKATGWYLGCGCGQKPGDLITPPVNSVDAWIPEGGSHVGPVTGISYQVVPNTTSIDIDRADFEVWSKDGVAHQPRPGFKGILTRVA